MSDFLDLARAFSLQAVAIRPTSAIPSLRRGVDLRAGPMAQDLIRRGPWPSNPVSLAVIAARFSYMSRCRSWR
jgi:hypothetical protein